MRRLIAIFCVILLLTATTAYGAEMSLYYDNVWHQYSAEDINLVINGKKVVTKEMPPIALMNRTLVPVREVFESIGGKVTWEPETDQVRITYKGNDLLFTLNSRNIYVGRTLYTIPTGEPTPMAINSKTMVPIRIIADLLGFSVDWDEKSRTVILADNGSGVSDDNKNTSDKNSSGGSSTGSGTAAKNGAISKITLSAADDMDLVYLAYSKPKEPKIYRYNSPERVVLDFSGAKLEDGYSELNFANGTTITSVRGANHDDMARIVLDVRNQPNITVARTATGIVIAATPAGRNYTTKVEDLEKGELFDPDTFAPADTNQPSDSQTGSNGKNSDDEVHLDTNGTVDTTNTLKLDYTTILIDPGHGGKDSGTVGGNVQEKNIALSISLKVRDKLLDAGYKVVMTRDSDTYPSLQDRVDIASTNTSNGGIPALYVSIHCNSFEENLSVNGTQVYYHPDSKYGTILAQNIYNRNVANTTLNPRQIHDGSTYFVIRKSLQPAALVETAFLSNEGDRAYLSSEEGQEALATGITEGIIMTIERMKSDKGIK